MSACSSHSFTSYCVTSSHPPFVQKEGNRCGCPQSRYCRGRLLNKHCYSVQIAAASPLVQLATIQFIQTQGCRGYKNCQISRFSNTALSAVNDRPALDVCLPESHIHGVQNISTGRSKKKQKKKYCELNLGLCLISHRKIQIWIIN